MEINISEHAYKRIKQRAGIKNHLAISKLADDAYDYGIRLEQATSKYERQYITQQSKHFNREVCLYKYQIFIWEGNTLVTMYKAEPDVIRTLIKIKNKQKKHTKNAAQKQVNNIGDI